VPMNGGNLIIQKVSPPVLPTPPVQVLPPPLTPEQLAARQAARAARPAPLQVRMLWFNVTVYGDNLSYIEWWPPGEMGQGYAAWSSADFRYMSVLQEFEFAAEGIRYVIFPFAVTRYSPSGSPPSVLAPRPDEETGFVLVKGGANNKAAVEPIAALHRHYKEKHAELKFAWEAREQAREDSEAWRAANPPPPPGDVVIRYWALDDAAAAAAYEAARSTNSQDAAK